MAIATREHSLSPLEQFDAYEARHSFKLFAKAAWPVIEPGTPLLWNWHLDVICDHLQAVFERRIKRLAITLSTGQNIKSFFQNTRRGYCMAVAVRSSATGKRASHLLIDDPNNAMAGRADIEATKEWFGKTWMSRLNDQENGPMIIVGQRLDEDDLIGHILKQGWEHVDLPEEYEPARAQTTSLGAYDVRTEEGELLWPEKFPREVLDKLKRALGALHYSAQYQQSPIPYGGFIYREKDRRWFTIDHTTQSYLLETPRGRVTVPITDCWNLAVIDLAVSTKNTADFFLMETWAITPYKDALLLHALHEHLDFPEQQQQIPLIFQRFHHSIIAVEKP